MSKRRPPSRGRSTPPLERRHEPPPAENPEHAAKVRIDAANKAVSPGFVDAHVHGDLALFQLRQYRVEVLFGDVG